jgi:hypothetical protein
VSEAHPFASAIEALVDRLLTDKVEAAVAARLAGAGAGLRPGRWVTPPVAARETGVPVKTIRAWARDGRLRKRVTNRSADPKQEKFKVNVDEVAAIAEGRSRGADDEPSDLNERAERILAARGR